MMMDAHIQTCVRAAVPWQWLAAYTFRTYIIDRLGDEPLNGKFHRPTAGSHLTLFRAATSGTRTTRIQVDVWLGPWHSLVCDIPLFKGRRDST